MLFRERIENYAINFLSEEIKTIDKWLKRKTVSSEEKRIFENLKKMYLQDLNKLEECDYGCKATK